jgi:hypothetical protein
MPRIAEICSLPAIRTVLAGPPGAPEEDEDLISATMQNIHDAVSFWNFACELRFVAMTAEFQEENPDIGEDALVFRCKSARGHWNGERFVGRDQFLNHYCLDCSDQLRL